MRYTRVAFLIVVVLGTVSTRTDMKALTESNLDIAPLQGAPPVGGIFPNKPLFVTQEEDGFLASVAAEGPLDAPTSAKFELLPPTPSFVKISSACRCELGGNSIAVMTVAPQRGDAGRYTVAVRATSYTGKTGTFTFKVKVQPK